MKVLFIGAGRWGLALASVLGNNGHEVRLLSRDKAEGEALNASGIHPFFPDFRFPASVKMTTDEAEAAAFSEVAVLSLPVQEMREMHLLYQHALACPRRLRR